MILVLVIRLYYAKGILLCWRDHISYCDYVEGTIAIGLGQTHYGYGCSHHGGGSSGSSVSFLQSNIGNSYYSHNYFPEISLDHDDPRLPIRFLI